jgi:hypothetical protein
VSRGPYQRALALAATIRSRRVSRPPEQPLRCKGIAVETCDARYSWADLMKRVFGHDVLRYHHGGNRRRSLALSTKPSVIRRILRHIGFPTELPPLEPSRQPLVFEFASRAAFERSPTLSKPDFRLVGEAAIACPRRGTPKAS